MDSKSQSFCNTFCQHPTCWKNMLNQMHGRNTDNDSSEVSFRQTERTYLDNTSKSTDASEYYYEIPELKSLWVTDLSSSIDLPFNEMDHLKLSNAQQQLLQYIGRKRKQSSRHNRSLIESANSSRNKFNKFDINENLNTDQENLAPVEKYMIWLPKSSKPCSTPKSAELFDSSSDQGQGPRSSLISSHFINERINLDGLSDQNRDIKRRVNKNAPPTGGQPYNREINKVLKQQHQHQQKQLIDLYGQPIQILKPSSLPSINESIDTSIQKVPSENLEEEIVAQSIDQKSVAAEPTLLPNGETIIINYPIKSRKRNLKNPHPNVKANFAMIQDLFALNLYDPRNVTPLKSTDLPTITTPNVTIHSPRNIDALSLADYAELESFNLTSSQQYKKELLVCPKVTIQDPDEKFKNFESANSFLTSSNYLIAPKNLVRLPTQKLPSINFVGYKSGRNVPNMNLSLGPLKVEEREDVPFDDENSSSRRATISSNCSFLQ